MSVSRNRAEVAGLGPPRESRIAEMRKMLAVTPEQEERLQALRREVGRPSPEKMEQLRAGMDQIFTPAQKARMRSHMRAMGQHRLDADKAKLPPDQAQKLQEKFEQRMAEMEKRGGMPFPPGAPQ